MRRIVAAIFVSISLVGCAPEKPEVVARNVSGDKAQVAVVVADESFTVEEVNQRLEAMPEWARARFSTLDRKKSFLATTVQFELLHDEAQRLDYATHPHTIHRLERRYVDAWVDEQVAKQPVSDEDLRAHFEANIDVFRRGLARRTYLLQTRSADRAAELRQRILTAAEAPDVSLLQAFQNAAADLSYDFVSRTNRGGIGAVTERGEVVPLPDTQFARAPDDTTGDFIEPVWKLEENQVSEPLEMADRFSLVMWSGELAPADVKFEQVVGEVREHLIAERRIEFVARYEM